MSKSIYIQVTLDAVGIMSAYPNSSKNANNPTQISLNYTYMVPSINAVSGSGTGDLEITALVGDDVNFAGVSASNNRQNTVLIYEVSRVSGDNVFTNFANRTLVARTAVPDGSSVIPPAIINENFSFFNATVIQRGTERYRITFALYTRDGSGEPVLYGYFTWDPTIIVQG
jgi:hypothetical protein